MQKPLVTIIIPSFNHLEDCLKPCLESIIKNTNLEMVEVIVVSDGSTDGTISYMVDLNKSYPCMNMIATPENIGYTESINRGMERAKGDYLVLLNNDTIILGPGWLEQLIEPFKNPKVAIVGPLALKDRLCDYSFIVFFCAAIPRAVVDEIGMLDLMFAPGGCEDIDYSIRVQKAGYLIHQLGPTTLGTSQHVGAFPIYHRGNVSFSEVADYSNNFAQNELKCAKKHGCR